MVKKKGKSKRISLKDKYKIQKRVVESNRKTRKQAKRDAKAGIVKHNKKKDPGIPNSWPFKQDLLNDIARARDRAEQRKLAEKEKRQNQLRDFNAHRKKGGTARSYEEMMAQANKDKQDFASNPNRGGNEAAAVRSEKQNLGQSSRRAYLKELKKVINGSDVILQVLDCRDPIGTRIHPSVEDAILRHYDKKMVIVLNKIDLVPKQAVAGWLKYLRRSHPTVAIKAGTNQSRGNIGQTKGESALQSSSGVGVESLLHLLKNYARHSSGDKKAKNSKASISVGIIGYPNVGKSSILNTMKRSRAVGVSPRPGFTTSMQEVVLDKSLRLIDSPGVVFDDVSGESQSGGHALLRNCVDADSVEDPIPAVQGLLERCSPESLMMTYSIPAFPKGDVMAFLAMVAKRSGRVIKGGIPDKVSAARTVIRDWNGGKIPYYTMPPASDEKGKDTSHKADAVIVKAFGDAFDVNQVDEEVLKGLPEDGMDFVKLEPSVPSDTKPSGDAARFLTGEDEGNESSDEEMDMDGVEGAAANSNAADADDYDFESM